MAKLHQLLESTELRARTDEVANLFYANFGKPQFWPVLDALWNLDDGKFPRVNWSAIRQPIVRLTIAGLWGQWSCGKLRSPDNVQVAAQYVRTQISSSDIQTRLEAISALGMVGESNDRKTLMTIARESDIAIAKRAASSIFSIEWHNSISPSYLLQLDDDATNVEVRNLVRVLLKSKRGP